MTFILLLLLFISTDCICLSRCVDVLIPVDFICRSQLTSIEDMIIHSKLECVCRFGSINKPCVGSYLDGTVRSQ